MIQACVLWRICLGILVLAICSCRTIGFYGQAISGQVEVMAKRQPIAEVVSGTNDEALKERMALTQRLLRFAEMELKMPSGGSYELYADLGREHLVWVVYAAPELSMEPKDWWYPVVGRQDYRGYFREDHARDEALRLEQRGYETWVGEVDAFSTLGWFRDPVLNTFAGYEEVDFAELIFHELVHRKYYVRGNTPFNEGMAEAVAREGVRRWFRQTGRPELVRKYEDRLKRIGQAGEEIGAAAERLRAVFEGDYSAEVKRERKQQELRSLKQGLSRLRGEWGGGLKSWIEDPVNNARLNSFITYEAEVPRFVALLEECDGDFEEFWNRVRTMEH
ncbi:aminopeptidase [Haloferula chungangensis]|uniref:Aminopeptidase n=1 Tax=Haloferula chungangensis TaxID=1048331 RepID=A0ABW2LA70_9BACT